MISRFQLIHFLKIDEELEKVYSNMSACHTRLGRWQRVIETADKALAINKENNKALFRKARALGELKYFEKAEAIFEELLKKDASGKFCPVTQYILLTNPSL